MDNRILSYIPHRSPMLLIDKLRSVSDNSSESELTISEESSFFVPGKGVPSWVGVEYMGQTAALIAGYQLEQGTIEPHIGLLLGTRKYEANAAWFSNKSHLIVSCEQVALVGNDLATFSCTIKEDATKAILARAKLSVFRRPKE